MTRVIYTYHFFDTITYCNVKRIVHLENKNVTRKLLKFQKEKTHSQNFTKKKKKGSLSRFEHTFIEKYISKKSKYTLSNNKVQKAS